MKSKSILFSILLTALFLSTVSAQVGENMNLIGRWGMGTCKAVSVYGSYLLMGNGATLDIWEVNGIRPYLTKKGHVDLPDVVSDITVAWPKAYLACEDMGLVIVDLSTISNPVLYGPFSTGGKAVAVSIYGEYAYIANGNHGMAVFNIGNVNSPVKTASFETDGEVLDVWADENIVYLAAGSAGFWTVNVTNHYAPVRLDSVHIAGTIKSVYIQRSTAYLASGSGGLNLVSIANPSGLSITGHWTTGGIMDATDVAVQKSTAYLTDARFGVRVIDVSAAPQSVWNVSTRGAATRITLNQRSYAFVAQDGTGMLLLDAFGTTPLRVDSLETGDQSKDVLFYGNTVYVAGGKSGLWVLNRSQGSLSVASRISSGMIDCQGLARKDTLLFAADGSGGLKVFNVRRPSEPVRLATQPVLSWAAGVGVYGNQVVVADGTSGLHLFGISNPRELSDLAVISLGSNTVRSVTVNAQRNLAFAATNAGTKVVDLQNRILLSSCPGSNDAYASDFSESGNTLYVADGANGIMGFDVSNALVPRLLEALHYDTDGTASDILVKGNAAIVADGEGTVRIVDMTSSPRQVGYYHSAGSSMGLSLSQDTLAVADGEAGVYLFKGNFAGTLTANQTLLDFSNVLIGKNRVLSLELANVGTSPVQVRNVSSSSGRFVPESGLPFSILPGSKYYLLVAFVPVAAQTVNDVLVIESDANNNPLRINIRGTGFVSESLGSYTPDYYTFLLYHMTSMVRDTIVPDESQYGFLDGVTKNATLSAPDSGPFGRALVFDSEEDKVSVRTDSLDRLPKFDGFTADTWFKLTQNQLGRKIIFKISQGTRTMFELAVDDLENQRVLAARSMSSAQDTVRLKAGSAFGLSLNKWYHAAVVYDGSFKLYLNGTRVDSVKTSLVEEDQNPITMVLGNTGSVKSIVGLIDEFRLSGIGRAPWEFNVCTGRIVLNATDLNFGNVMLPNSRRLAVLVQNNGAGTLYVDSVKTSNPRYTVSPRSFTMASGTASILYVTFTPAAVGTTVGAMDVYSRDPFNPTKRILLTGNGYAKITQPGPYSTDYYTVGLWHCDGAQGDTVIQDASSYNLRGGFRSSGVSWDRTTPRWGSSALAFNGGNGWVNIYNNEILNFGASTFTRGFTLETWFRLAAKPQSGYWSMIRRGWGSTGQLEILYGDSLQGGQGISARLVSSTGQILVLRGPVDSNMQIGNWYHMALTWDWYKLRLFLNGVRVDSAAFAGNLRASNAGISIGGSYGLGHGFNGTFDEMRLSGIDRQTWEFNIVGPRLQASSYSLAFGQVLLGESQSQDLLLSNQGDQTLAISSIQTKTASFSASPTSAQIAMGQGQTLHVTFAPKATGANADTVKITSNDPNQGILTIRLTGTGVNYRSKVAYALDDYTVALFHFDETSGSAAVDANGGRHNGTLADGVSQTSSGYYGGALHFNGKSGHVLIPNADDLVFDMASKSFTIECFFRTDTVSKAVFFKDIAAGTDKSNYGFSIDNAGRIGSYGFGTASAWVADNAWHHAAFVYDAQTQYGSLFIDGSLSSQQAWAAGKTDTKNPRGLIIGAQEVATSSFANVFEGDIDELRISGVARKPWEFLLARSGIDVTLAAVPSLGSNATVNITVPSDTASKTLTLYYRQGGASTYTTLPATLIDATHYRAVIPGSSVTFKGLEFYVEKYTARERTTQPLYDPVRAPIAAAVRFASQAADITLSAKKYAMVSVPADLDKTRVRSVLSDDMGKTDPTRWRCFAFKDTSYAEFSDTLAYADSAWFNFTRGTAFWIISEQAKSFNVGAGISTALESPYRLTLRPQWNMVGSVFPFPVAWDDCALSSPSIGTLYYYDGSGYRIDWAVMDPWKGYWLYNTDTKSQTVYVPPRASTTSGVTKRGVCSDMADGEWLWRISAETDAAKDLDNYAGVRNEAKDAWDLLDRFEPPPIGEYITLYVDHRDWSEHAGSYAADIRQPGRDGYAWDFVMESSLIDQTISLHWDWKQSLPEGWVAYLIDETDGNVFPLAERKSLSVSTGRKAPTVRLYKFIAGTPAFVEKASDLPLVPLEFQLYPNFPNPFNPRTTIRYSLPQTAEVKLTIYNMLGQEVKVLVNGPQKAGTHQAEWDGSDRNGIQVGSGLYLSRLESLGRTAIRKLILVK